MSVTNFLVPFGGLSGIDAAETDFDAGLGQQLWGLAAAALPTSSGCDALDCLPVSPTSPITGISGVDWFIWLSQILNGQQEFPLFDNWFKVSFDQVLAGYYFDPAADGSTDPSGPAYTIFDNMPGTGLGDAMPWSGMTYTLQPWVPIENWINDLQAPVGEDYFDGFDIPTFEEFGRAVQALSAAAVVAFDPFTPGSPFCPGECTIVTDGNADYNDFVQAINQAWPGNETIETWLQAYDTALRTFQPRNKSRMPIHILQQGFWDFDNTESARREWPRLHRDVGVVLQLLDVAWLRSKQQPRAIRLLCAGRCIHSRTAERRLDRVGECRRPQPGPSRLDRFGECLRPRSAHGRLGFLGSRSRSHIDGEPNGRQCWPGSVCSRARWSPVVARGPTTRYASSGAHLDTHARRAWLMAARWPPADRSNQSDNSAALITRAVNLRVSRVTRTSCAKFGGFRYVLRIS